MDRNGPKAASLTAELSHLYAARYFFLSYLVDNKDQTHLFGPLQVKLSRVCSLAPAIVPGHMPQVPYDFFSLTLIGLLPLDSGWTIVAVCQPRHHP